MASSHQCSSSVIFRLLLVCVSVLLGPPGARAQYEVYQWASFEDGKLPENSITIGADPDKRVQVVDLDTVQGVPPPFRSPEARRETGRFGLKLTSTGRDGNYLTGLAVGAILDRDKLGPKGRAIYQADFFLPAGEGNLPSLAVLAMEPPQEVQKAYTPNVHTVDKPYYRFGMTLGKSLYFSRFIPKEKDPPYYTKDTPLLQELPLPGWHRFAIVFDGPNHIRCYIDGRETRFSPLPMPQFRKLMVGVMLADNQRAYDAYVDNLSIQVSQDAPQLPDSPYVTGWRIPPGPATLRAKALAAAGVAPLPDSRWIDPTEAWKKAQESRIPLLLYFYAPGLPGTAAMEHIFSSHPAAKAFLDKCVCARVDANQLSGGMIAKQYEVFKFPTVLIIAPDLSWHRRATLGNNATWESFVSQIQSP